MWCQLPPVSVTERSVTSQPESRHGGLDMRLIAVFDEPGVDRGLIPEARAARQRLDEKFDLRPAGFGHRVGIKAARRAHGGLLIEDGRLREVRGETVALAQEDLEHLELDAAGGAQMDLALFGHPDELEQRILLAELSQRAEQRHQIVVALRHGAHGEQRRRERDGHAGDRPVSDDVSRAHGGQPRDRGDVAGADLAHILRFPAGHGTKLRDLLLGAGARHEYRVAAAQRAGKQARMGKLAERGIVLDLVDDACERGRVIGRVGRVVREGVEKRFDARAGLGRAREHEHRAAVKTRAAQC